MPFDITSPTRPAQPGDVCVIWRDQRLCLPAHGGLPRVGEAALTSLRHLGELDGAPCYVGELVGAPPADWRETSLRAALAGQTPPDWAPLLARASMLRQFDRSHRYCSACATPLRDHGHDHGKVCPSCGLWPTRNTPGGKCGERASSS
jgi:NAD+ diphosphatase